MNDYNTLIDENEPDTDDEQQFRTFDTDKVVTMSQVIKTDDLSDDQVGTLEDIAMLFEDRLVARAESMRSE